MIPSWLHLHGHTVPGMYLPWTWVSFFSLFFSSAESELMIIFRSLGSTGGSSRNISGEIKRALSSNGYQVPAFFSAHQPVIKQLPTILFYSDNLETIQRIKAPARETDNDTLRHDYDLFAEVS
jgi:hypothetical protein